MGSPERMPGLPTQIRLEERIHPGQKGIKKPITQSKVCPHRDSLRSNRTFDLSGRPGKLQPFETLLSGQLNNAEQHSHIEFEFLIDFRIIPQEMSIQDFPVLY